MPKGKHKTVSKAKAKEILRHGEVGGRPLTKKQKGFFGARAGGQPVKGVKRTPRKKTTKRPRTRRTARKRTTRKR